MTSELPFDGPYRPARTQAAKLATPSPAEGIAEADDAARRAAEVEFTSPLILEAGAGTGKTATLVARIVVWSLGLGWEKARADEANGVEPAHVAARVLSRVTAITFTDAAAAEMAMRVGQALHDIAQGGVPIGVHEEYLPDPNERATRASHLAAALDHLGVRTIHGLCQKLLSENPIEAGVHPHFEVDADGSLVRGVVREVLEEELARELPQASRDAPLIVLARGGFGPAELELAVYELMQSGCPADAFDSDPLAPERAGPVLLEWQRAIFALRDSDEGFWPSAKKNALHIRERIGASEVEFGNWLPEDPHSTRETIESLRSTWDDRALRHLKKWSTTGPGKTEERALRPECIAAFERAARTLVPVVKSLGDIDLERLQTVRTAFAPLLHAVHSRLHERGVLTFDHLLSRACSLLESKPRVRARVRSGIDQLLVDEFQDTDATQCAIVRALALPARPGQPVQSEPSGESEARPGLFIVGDPKQSIYGWRRADLAAYDAFTREVMGAGGSVHALSVNFRSVPAILTAVEDVIGPVMVEEEGLQPPFFPLTASAKNAGKAGFRIGAWEPVEHWVSWAELEDPTDEPEHKEQAPAPDPDTKKGTATRIEARALARDLAALRGVPGFEWQQAAILFRSMSELDVYLTELREAGIPYEVERDRNYYLRREVIEASAYVRCVVDPFDQLALVSFLRSATVGVPDAAWIPLYAGEFPGLMARLTGPEASALPKLEELVRETASSVAKLAAEVPGLDRIEGWGANLIEAIRRIAELRWQWTQLATDRFVDALRKALLIEATEAERFLGPYRLANLDRFFRWLETELEVRGGDAESLLRNLARRVQEREYAEEARPKKAARNAVQVMTIHKSKGLDFRHVYLVQLHKGTYKANANVDFEEYRGELEYSLCKTCTPGYGAVRSRRSRVEECERVRLLYVAMTRAEERLVLAGKWPTHAKRDTQDSLLELIETALGARKPELEREFSRVPAAAPQVLHAGARWLFPDRSAAGDPVRTKAGRAEFKSTAQARADARALVELGCEAEARMARPFGRAASHKDAEAVPAASRSGAPSRAIAQAVGTAMHTLLEDFDLAATGAEAMAAELALRKSELAERLTALPKSERRAGWAWAESLLAATAEGGLLQRLTGLGPHVIARELPVLAPPSATDPSAPVGYVSGVIDLLYRDPVSGDYVVADFKTDDVESVGECEARAAAYASQGESYVTAVRAALDLAATPRFELWFLAAGHVVVSGP